MENVSLDVAQKDIERWLEFKRISSRRREDLSDQIDALVGMVSDGSLVVKEDCSMELSLSVELEDGTSKLDFKPRLQLRQVQPRLKEVKAGDGDGRIMAYLSALTGKNTGVLGLMDTVDYTACSNIVIFFL